MIKDVKSTRSGKVRRAKLFYLRGKLNKQDARIQENKKAIRVPVEGTDERPEVAVVEAAQPAAEAPSTTESKA